MDRQVAAEAVPGTVIEVEADLPEGEARQAVEVMLTAAIRKDCERELDVPLQDAGELCPQRLGRCRLAKPDGAGDVGSAGGILAAAVDEVELTAAQRCRRRGFRVVVHQGRVRTGGRDGVEARSQIRVA